MTSTSLESVNLPEGKEFPPIVYGPITRTTLALFAGGSGDHNPIHIDIDFAKAAGLDDVIAHGMLSMAYMGRYLEIIVGRGRVRTWSVRFTSAIGVGDRIRCSARVLRRNTANGGITLSLTAQNQREHPVAIGEAEIEVGPQSRPVE